MFHIGMLCGMFSELGKKTVSMHGLVVFFVNPVDCLIFLAMVYN